MRWLSFIYETPLGLVSLYLCSYLQGTNSRFAFCPCDVLLVPRARTELGERALSLAALSVWNSLQTDLKLSELISLDAFSSFFNDRHTCVFKLSSELQHFIISLWNAHLNCSCICFKLIVCKLLLILFVDVLLTSWPGQPSERYFGSRQVKYLIK